MKRLARLFLLIMLLLSGWGWRDIGGFVSSPARIIACLLLLAFVISSPFYRKAPLSAERAMIDPGQCWLILTCQMSILILAWYLPYADHHELFTFDGTYLRWVGVGLFLCGGLIQMWAIRTLDKQYSPFVTLQSNHMLVQGGIYGFVRHPIYLGLLFGLPGFVLAFRNWLVLPVSLLTGLFVIMRIYQEDQLLSNQFGLEFEAYRGRTTRLIPYIY